jgi:hypothetical protein
MHLHHAMWGGTASVPVWPKVVTAALAYVSLNFVITGLLALNVF